jgi:EAL domain-containing protein (putative c-di-GMP-specific phosphodiesterase class I)
VTIEGSNPLPSKAAIPAANLLSWLAAGAWLFAAILIGAAMQPGLREGVLLGLVAILATVVVLLLWRHRQSKARLAAERRQLSTAVNNIPQGLVLYDASARIVICNQPYIEMFGLSPEVVKPGCTMQRLIAHRKETGSFDGDIDEFCNAIIRNVSLGKATRQLTEAPGGRAIEIVELIPIAEETGLINELGCFVLDAACREAAGWPEQVRVAVNVSPVQFKSQALALNVAAALARSGIAASRLELEITEAVLIRDDEVALAVLHQLRGLGVRIALDDFGTGYSSLSYLQRFPFDKIKIDRSFINDLGGAGASSSIVQAVVNIAAASDMTTTAEGVETEQQRNWLHILGCTEMQGYLFSPAIPAAEIRDLLQAHRRKVVSAA